MANKRTLVSYDDITSQEPPPTQLGSHLPSAHPPPAKKRRTQQKAPPRRNTQPIQHWDDPNTPVEAMTHRNDFGVARENSAPAGYGGDGDEEDGEESRELTHEEVWDDSALIEAWDSAIAEYEAFHGKGKDWKQDPVKKSPLWFNIPPDPSGLKANRPSANTTKLAAVNGSVSEHGGEEDSQPINFDTFVPSHDPSLGPTPGAFDFNAAMPRHFLPGSPVPMVDQDEAFSRAMSAMYWSGYWTAAYHYNRHSGNLSVEIQQDNGLEVEGEEDGADETAGDAAMDDDLISAQR